MGDVGDKILPDGREFFNLLRHVIDGPCKRRQVRYRRDSQTEGKITMPQLLHPFLYVRNRTDRAQRHQIAHGQSSHKDNDGDDNDHVVGNREFAQQHALGDSHTDDSLCWSL